MGCNGIASGIFVCNAMNCEGLTQQIACDMIPPLKASAPSSRDGLETEGTVSILPVRSSSESQRSCPLATIHI